jgi:hypothetical protein
MQTNMLVSQTIDVLMTDCYLVSCLKDIIRTILLQDVCMLQFYVQTFLIWLFSKATGYGVKGDG